MDDDITKFCVSWFVSRVADTGIKQVIDGWNNHPIPGKEIFPEIVINIIYNIFWWAILISVLHQINLKRSRLCF